jgi:hypothetical protein
MQSLSMQARSPRPRYAQSGSSKAPSKKFLRLCLLPLLVSTLCFAEQPDRIAGAIEHTPSVVLTKSVHFKAKPQNDRGAVDPSLKLSYITLLMGPAPAQQKLLDQFLIDVQNPKSPSYHKFLTVQQYADKYGLSQNDLNKITAWLTSQGFEIVRTGGGRNLVIFSGTAAQVHSAFGVEIHKYSVDGETHIANSSPIMVPAALGGMVRSVMGLHDFHGLPTYRRRGQFASKARRQYYDANYLWPNFLAPGDVATIYDIQTLYDASPAIDGTGQKLAIAGETDLLLADINDFRNGFSLNPIPTGSGGCTTNASTGIIIAPCDTTYFKYVLLGTDPGSVSVYDIGEADLDVEWSGAVARGAQIVYVNGQTANGVFDALTDAIDPGTSQNPLPPLAPVVSISYGEGCEAQATLDLESTFQEGNTMGVTILNSSGDVGSASCDYNPQNDTPPYDPAVGGLGVSYPASSPEVTAVGGTEIPIGDDPNPAAPPYWGGSGPNGDTALEYIPEIAWNDDVVFGTFCDENIGNSHYASLCDPSPGVEVTNAQTFQQDYWISSSGGGASNCWYETPEDICQGAGAGPTTGGGFAQPSYQSGLSVSGAPSGVRWVPDISFMASPNFPGYIFCTPINPPSDNTSTCSDGIFNAVDVNESLVGGTSVSSPLFAGIVTLLNQYLGASSGSGNINTKLYSLAAAPSNTVFHHAISGTNNVYCTAGTPSGQPTNVQCPSTGVMGYSASASDATTGYNLVTGLGSVDVDQLFTAWSNSLVAADFTLTSGTLTPTSVPAGQAATATLTITPVNGSTQSITFTSSSCSGQPAGATCSFSPATITLDGTDAQTVQLTVTTTANMALPASASSITVTATSSGTGSTSHTASVSLNVTTTNQTFTITPNAQTYVVAVGGTASVVLAVAGTGSPLNFVSNSQTALAITYTCTGLPSETNCNPVSNQPTTSSSPTVSIVTQGATAQLQHSRGNRMFYALLLPGFFGVVLLAGPRRRGIRLLSLIVVLGFSTMWLGSCGGGSSGNSQSNPGTPTGTYTVTINATTGGSNPLTASTTVMLTVNPQ